MPVPDFQSLMLPLLKSARDRQEHSIGIAAVAVYTLKRVDSDYFEEE